MKKIVILFAAAAVLLSGRLAGAASAQKEKNYLPVICVGALMGAYDENGGWQNAPGTVTVNGKSVVLDEVEENEELMKMLGDGDGVPCETEMIGPGQRLAYWGPEGRLGEGTVTETSVWYMGDASGAATLDVAVEGFDGEWSNLIVGMSDAVDAWIAPTTRETDGGKTVFVCDSGGGEKYSVSWTPDGETFKGTVTVNGDSWEITDGDIAPGDLEDLQCGFFYFGVGGGFELVIYDSGISGFAAIYRVTPGKGIQQLAWLYTGEE
jgi:hypothetical protein